MAGKFEVYEDKAGKFRFRLKAGNGEIVAWARHTTRRRQPRMGVLRCSGPLRARALWRPTAKGRGGGCLTRHHSGGQAAHSQAFHEPSRVPGDCAHPLGWLNVRVTS